ncbi:MAG: serine/threonine-protein kinase [Myxococcota bacterium]
MADSVEGRRLGAYEIGPRLGAGGIGAVYEATHVRTGRPYAVKILLPESALEPNALERFQREAEALAALGHASIVAIHDFNVTDDGIAYLVMDRLHGEDLSARLERGPLSPDEAMRVFDQIAEALITAHEAGILHRDLKPSNVFLARRPGASERAVLLDFGLAKMMGSDGARLTASGATMGTPMYMSPEQAQGHKVDERTDVYSLGAILFEILTGAPPFTGPTITAILTKVLTHPPPPLRSMEPTAPEALEPVLREILAKNPDERPRTIRALQAKVHRAIVGAAATTPTSQPARSVPETQQTPRRPIEPHVPTKDRRWIALVVGILLGGAVIAAWVLTRPKAPVPTPVAPTEVRGTPAP